MKIPFMKPPLTGNEQKYFKEAWESNWHGGDGKFTKLCNEFLKNEFGIKKSLLTTSGTDALEMCSFLANAMPGKEVIFPSYTFSSTANAFVSHGATPVFIDVERETLNMDPSLIENAISEKTIAICPIHYAGLPADMDKINAIAKKYNLIVIEDAAQAIGSKYQGRFAGSLCELGAFSFHATKSISCGEGGALTINDEQFSQRAQFLWEKGTDRSLVLEGKLNKYQWVDKGSSFLPSDLISAILWAQLENWKMLHEKRKQVFDQYTQILKNYNHLDLNFAPVPKGYESNYHAFWILFDDNKTKDNFQKHCTEKGVTTYNHYVPLHSSVMGNKVSRTASKMETTNLAGENCIRLPMYPMNDLEIKYVGEVINSALKNCANLKLAKSA